MFKVEHRTKRCITVRVKDDTGENVWQCRWRSNVKPNGNCFVLFHLLASHTPCRPADFGPFQFVHHFIAQLPKNDEHT